jgi:hypothetical protein
MLLARARVRYLAAIALALPGAAAALSATACKKAERTAQERTRPRVEAAATQGVDHEAKCARGTFCIPENDKPKEVRAAPPHEACSIIEPLPDGVPEGWPQERRQKLRIRFDDETTGKARAAEQRDACCYRWMEHCAGRALRGGEDGRAVTAPAVVGEGWSDEGAPGDLGAEAMPEATRAALAAHFVGEAAFEHASIAAFSRAALELVALGAPAGLVMGVVAAAGDEVRHARLAYSMASRLRGGRVGPGPLPEAAAPLGEVTAAAVAVSSFVDGCVGEAVAAVVLREAAAAAASPELRRLFESLAEDEERHAELAWSIAAWAVGVGGAGALEAVRQAALELERDVEAPVHAGGVPRAGDLDALVLASGAPSSEDLRAYGVLSEEERRAIRSRVVREVVLPCAAALLERAGLRDPLAAPLLGVAPRAGARA